MDICLAVHTFVHALEGTANSHWRHPDALIVNTNSTFCEWFNISGSTNHLLDLGARNTNLLLRVARPCILSEARAPPRQCTQTGFSNARSAACTMKALRVLAAGILLSTDRRISRTFHGSRPALSHPMSPSTESKNVPRDLRAQGTPTALSSRPTSNELLNGSTSGKHHILGSHGMRLNLPRMQTNHQRMVQWRLHNADISTQLMDASDLPGGRPGWSEPKPANNGDIRKTQNSSHGVQDM
ncbi:hypothetical protein FB451DRAFT_1481263 [Mycena latifolia]|nr:hypothetical protein FB451DRAFT_1481263 [Mycena latifolia]